MLHMCTIFMVIHSNWDSISFISFNSNVNFDSIVHVVSFLEGQLVLIKPSFSRPLCSSNMNPLWFLSIIHSCLLYHIFSQTLVKNILSYVSKYRSLQYCKWYIYIIFNIHIYYLNTFIQNITTQQHNQVFQIISKVTKSYCVAADKTLFRKQIINFIKEIFKEFLFKISTIPCWLMKAQVVALL